MPTMSIDAVVCELGLVIFGTALYFLMERYITKLKWLLAICIVGLCVSLYPIFLHFHPGNPQSVSRWLYMFSLFGASALLAYDIYLRRRRAKTSSELVIHSAFYGAGPREIDVTNLLQNLVRTGLVIEVSNSTFGTDPAPMIGKSLQVEYSYGTSRRLKALGVEGTRLILPQ